MKPRKSNVTFSDDAALEYIMALENPHKVGWDSKNRVWRTPKEKGYDKNQIAYGLDIRQDHNPVVYNFLKEKGRLKDPWLTEGEATDLMALLYAAKNSSVNKAVEKIGGNISQRGYNVLRGMAWHGHPMKQLLNPDSITGKAFLRAIANGDQDLNSVFDAYYGYGSNATQFADRIKADAKQRGSIIMETLGDGNKRMTFKPVPQWEPQPLPKPIPETQYPLSGSQAPESLSSWNAALSPSATPTIPSILKLNNERQKAVQGAFLLPEVTVLGNRRTSLLPKMPSLNDALMAYSPLNLMNRALSESLGLNDLWDDSDVTSDLFKFKNGKLPRYGDGLVPGLGKPKKLTPRDIKVSPGEPGLLTVGPMEKALIGWLGGRAITGALSMYNRARAFKLAKETYRQARLWNELTRDASRAWKIADADKTARNPFYSGSDEPLGWLYDTLLRPAINAYDKLNQSPIGIILP